MCSQHLLYRYQSTLRNRSLAIKFESSATHRHIIQAQYTDTARMHNTRAQHNTQAQHTQAHHTHITQIHTCTAHRHNKKAQHTGARHMHITQTHTDTTHRRITQAQHTGGRITRPSVGDAVLGDPSSASSSCTASNCMDPVRWYNLRANACA